MRTLHLILLALAIAVGLSLLLWLGPESSQPQEPEEPTTRLDSDPTPGQTSQLELSSPNENRTATLAGGQSPRRRRTPVDSSNVTEEIRKQLIDEALRDPRPEYRAAALADMARLPHSVDFMRTAIRALRDPDDEVRRQALLTIDQRGAPSAERFLVRVAESDPSPELRELAQQVLDRLK